MAWKPWLAMESLSLGQRGSVVPLGGNCQKSVLVDKILAHALMSVKHKHICASCIPAQQAPSVKNRRIALLSKLFRETRCVSFRCSYSRTFHPTIAKCRPFVPSPTWPSAMVSVHFRVGYAGILKRCSHNLRFDSRHYITKYLGNLRPVWKNDFYLLFFSQRRSCPVATTARTTSGCTR